jgi:tetratricopeptide (TPR) repeat protein
VEYYANRPERALAAWRRSLEIDEKFFSPVFQLSYRWLGIEATLDQALPPSATLLVRIAETWFGGNSKIPEPARSADRAAILKRALAALPKLPKGAAKARTAAMLYALSGEPKLAAESFEEALTVTPMDVNLRLRYASLLESEKRYADAARQAEIAYNLSSRNPAVGEILARLEKLASRGRAP